MEKTIKEVFKDYNSNSFELNEAKIKTVVKGMIEGVVNAEDEKEKTDENDG